MITDTVKYSLLRFANTTLNNAIIACGAEPFDQDGCPQWAPELSDEDVARIRGYIYREPTNEEINYAGVNYAEAAFRMIPVMEAVQAGRLPRLYEVPA